MQLWYGHLILGTDFEADFVYVAETNCGNVAPGLYRVCSWCPVIDRAINARFTGCRYQQTRVSIPLYTM